MRRARASVLLALPLALTLVVTLPVSARSPGAAVYQPSAQPNGASRVDLAEAWVDWAFQAVDTNPLLNPRCEYSGIGNIWFAPVSIGGDIELDCTIPAGGKLFMSAGGVECSTAEDGGDTPEELSACVDSLLPFICCVQAEVDGVAVENIDRYMLKTDGQILAGPSLITDDPTLIVQGGWFLIARPMSVGEHEVFLHDAVPAFDLAFSATIHVTVVPH
jgi:hypothetical protein